MSLVFCENDTVMPSSLTPPAPRNPAARLLVAFVGAVVPLGANQASSVPSDPPAPTPTMRLALSDTAVSPSGHAKRPDRCGRAFGCSGCLVGGSASYWVRPLAALAQVARSAGRTQVH